MTDHIDATRGFKPLQRSRQDEATQRPQTGKPKVAGEDRVSINQSEAAEATYAPAALKIGAPYELLRNLVVKTLQEQQVPLLVSTGEGEIDLSTLTVEDAQELISEDGYFGVKQTSDRIVDFAINAFGNDPSRLEEMKKAIDQGFLDAQKAFGGQLPEISQQTYNAVMEKLEAFAQADSAAD
jgi:hypothetical protein